MQTVIKCPAWKERTPKRHVRSYLLQIPPNARIHTLKTIIFQVLPWNIVHILLNCSGSHFCVPIIPTIGARQVRAAPCVSSASVCCSFTHSSVHSLTHTLSIRSWSLTWILKMSAPRTWARKTASLIYTLRNCIQSCDRLTQGLLLSPVGLGVKKSFKEEKASGKGQLFLVQTGVWRTNIKGEHESKEIRVYMQIEATVKCVKKIVITPTHSPFPG